MTRPDRTDPTRPDASDATRQDSTGPDMTGPDRTDPTRPDAPPSLFHGLPPQAPQCGALALGCPHSRQGRPPRTDAAARIP